MIEAHLIDSRGVYLRTEEVDPLGPQPAGAIYGDLPEANASHVRMWLASEWQQVPEADVPPVPQLPEVVRAQPQLTPLEYLDLFTDAEQLAVVGATMVVPAVKLWYDRMLAASFVSFADPRTEGGLQALVDANLLTLQRKSEISAAMQAG